ncbi:MAG: methyltransferase domain-containing protein [Pseudomonadota bacterium]
MSDDPDVNDAYGLSSKEDVKKLYETWSHSYDTAFHDGQGYQLAREVAEAFVAAGGAGPVLDVGAGTGLVGAHLRAMNITPIDGVDLSEDMLQVAGIKGDYRGLFPGDVTAPLQLLDAPYTGIVSAGTFTLGHVGPEALRNVLDVAAPDARCVISVNATHFEAAGFSTTLDNLANEIKDLHIRDVRIYDDRADEEHRNDIARLMIFRRA